MRRDKLPEEMFPTYQEQPGFSSGNSDGAFEPFGEGDADEITYTHAGNQGAPDTLMPVSMRGDAFAGIEKLLATQADNVHVDQTYGSDALADQQINWDVASDPYYKGS